MLSRNEPNNVYQAIQPSPLRETHVACGDAKCEWGSAAKIKTLNPSPHRNQSSKTTLDHQLFQTLKLPGNGSNNVYHAI